MKRTHRTHSYPVVIGIGLSARDKYLIDYWFGEYPVQKKKNADTLSPGQFAQGLHYFPSSDLELIEEINQWSVPILVIARKKETEHKQLFSYLWKLGIAALWILPDFGEEVSFPFISLPYADSSKKTVFLLDESIVPRNLLKQIFYFAGYHVLFDFFSTKDVILAMKNGNMPDILYLNLDHPHVHHVELISSLKYFLKNHKQIEKEKSSTQLIFTKDFRIPGFSFTSLESLLASYVHRIFDPKESIFALLQAFFSHSGNIEANGDMELQKILTGSSPIGLQQENREGITNRGLLPFLWLYNFWTQDMERGIILGK